LGGLIFLILSWGYLDFFVRLVFLHIFRAKFGLVYVELVWLWLDSLLWSRFVKCVWIGSGC